MRVCGRKFLAGTTPTLVRVHEKFVVTQPVKFLALWSLSFITVFRKSLSVAPIWIITLTDQVNIVLYVGLAVALFAGIDGVREHVFVSWPRVL